MKMSDPTPHHPLSKKLLALFVLFSFLVGCTAPNQPGRSGSSSDQQNANNIPRATITPLGNGAKRFHTSNNGGILSMDFGMSTGNLWDRLPNGFMLADESNNPAVQSQIRWFLKHPQYLERTSHRAAPYIYYIYDQVQKRQLPTELVLLPINESAYNPFSTSVAGAGGIWQMTRGTASQYKVKQNWWYDGRRDVYTSTKAALDHLTYLQNFFNGDWLLVLAAYNCGEGTVQRAIRRNAAQGKPTDFWSLPLPEETRSYVPRLLALAIIIRDRQAYNIELPPIEDQPYLAQVDVETPMSLAEAARLSNLDVSELKKLNPAHRYTSKAAQGPFKLVLPIDRVDIFKNNLLSYNGASPSQDWSSDEEPAYNNGPSENTKSRSRIQTLPSGQAITRVVKRGDNIGMIAKLYKVSPKNIVRWNHLASTKLKPGSKIVVGFLDNGPSSDSKKTKIAKRPEQTKNANRRYVVRRGDTLSKVAAREQVSVSSIQAWNHLGRNQALKPGQELVIHRG